MPRGPGRPPKKLAAAAAKESAASSTSGPPSQADSESEADTSPRRGEADHSYKAPQWLLQENQTPKFFSVPIPPVNPATAQAIQRRCAPENAAQRKLRKKTNEALETIRQLQHDQKTQAKRIKNQTEKLSNALARKEKGLQQIRREKEQELETKLKKVEEKVRNEQEATFLKQQEAMKQEIQESFEKEFEAEQSARKRKLEEERKAEEEAANDESKKQKIKAEEKKELESEKIKIKVDEFQTKLDKLQEKKSEMVWLLKQVIKADAKRKVELLRLQKSEQAAST